ncbi:hypothetical protein RISK_000958 [Rhodopirellula islandica]|uniref:Uncharacterized protein n=1 Tax=Rhodopirellula islandica TaxID=595434 RepID=A0A0J1BKX5_RHOIS|nr:hypothetical protein RISK_000958 [Rhodopirellula islandica]
MDRSRRGGWVLAAMDMVQTVRTYWVRTKGSRGVATALKATVASNPSSHGLLGAAKLMGGIRAIENLDGLRQF